MNENPLWSDGDGGRYNGPGTHHERFVTNTEMLLIGVTLWRTAQWYKENQRRLSPEEQAQYELETERWKNYLRWENATPGAREARDQYVWEQEREAWEYQQRCEVLGRRWFIWRPVTLAIVIGVTANVIPGMGGFRQGAIEGAAGFVLWVVLWAVRNWFGRRWDASTVLIQEAAAQAVESRPVESSPYLPVLYKSKPNQERA
jgi:hypothetical protein